MGEPIQGKVHEGKNIMNPSAGLDETNRRRSSTSRPQQSYRLGGRRQTNAWQPTLFVEMCKNASGGVYCDKVEKNGSSQS